MRRPTIWIGIISMAFVTALFGNGSLWAEEERMRQEASRQDETQLLAGDRIRLNIFERLSLDEDQWAKRKRAGRPDQSYYPRQDLSGDFVVQSGGSLPLPLLGNIPVEDRSAASVMREIAERFEQITTHQARVSYAILERMPVSIVGPVKQPGVYRFVDGMSVLHVVALAGGYKQTDDSWGKVEFARQANTLPALRQRWQRLEAEATLLRAERDHVSDKIALSGLKEIDRSIVNEIHADMLRSRQAMAAHRTTLDMAVSAANDLQKAVEERLRATELAVQDRRERVEALRKLVDRSTIGRPVFLQASVELSEAEERRTQAVAALGEAKYRAALAQIAVSKFEIDTQVALDNLLAKRNQEARDAEAAVEAAEAAVLVLTPEQSAGAAKIEIIRKFKSGWNLIAGDSYTTLKPGDLVVVSGQDNVARSAD